MEDVWAYRFGILVISGLFVYMTISYIKVAKRWLNAVLEQVELAREAKRLADRNVELAELNESLAGEIALVAKKNLELATKNLELFERSRRTDMRTADQLVRFLGHWSELSAEDRVDRICLYIESMVVDCMKTRTPCCAFKLGGNSFSVREEVIKKLEKSLYLVEVVEQTATAMVIHIVWNKAEHGRVENHEVFGKPIGDA